MRNAKKREFEKISNFTSCLMLNTEAGQKIEPTAQWLKPFECALLFDPMLPPIVEGYLNLLIGQNKEIAKVRLQICQSNVCGYYTKLGTCSHGCNCIMKAKASISHVHCPIKKW